MIKAIFDLMEVPLVNPFEKVKHARHVPFSSLNKEMDNLPSCSFSFKCPQRKYGIRVMFDSVRGRSFADALKAGVVSTLLAKKKGSDLANSKFKKKKRNHFPALGGGILGPVPSKPIIKKPKFSREEKGKGVDHVGSSKEAHMFFGARSRSSKFKPNSLKVIWRHEGGHQTQIKNPNKQIVYASEFSPVKISARTTSGEWWNQQCGCVVLQK